MKISVVTPTLNEEESVEKVITDIRKATNDQTEIIVVDSGTDRTAEIALRLRATVFRIDPKGYGVSMKYGLRKATGDVVITTDCDGTYPMEQIPEFIKCIEDGYDVVSGTRLAKKGKHVPFFNRLANVGFAVLLRLLYGIKVTDVTTGMKACRREVVQGIDWESNWALPVELLIRPVRHGYKLKEISIDFKERYGGETKLRRFGMGMAYLRCLLKYKFDLHYTEDRM